MRWAVRLAGLYGVGQIALLIALFSNHVSFPWQLNVMEGVLHQHYARAAAGQAVYPAPTPDYVPLAYNPLFYGIGVPFGWFADGFATLRCAAFAGTLVSGLMIFLAVRRATGEAAWGLVAAGLFAGAYRTMECYLDVGHPDSWLLALTLLGAWQLDRARRPGGLVLAGVLLCGAFWIKQHGAIFAAAACMYAAWRDGPRRAWPLWLTVLLLGPGAYLFGPAVLGERFHFFTWTVPRAWTDVDRTALIEFAQFMLRNYGLLLLGGAGLVVWRGLRDRARFDAWHALFCAAFLSGCMGTLDPGCAYNVFIPFGGFSILLGTIAMGTAARQCSRSGLAWLAPLAVATSFALLAYDPRPLWRPTAPARAAYLDLLAELRRLDGPVYCPDVGQLPRDFVFAPAAHWVALEDLVRGPGRDPRDQPIVRALLEPAMPADGPAYVLTQLPLQDRASFLGFLVRAVTPAADFGDRFAALRGLPGRYEHGFPRYLYRCCVAARTVPASRPSDARPATDPTP